MDQQTEESGREQPRETKTHPVTVEEVFVFKLAKELGGREQVLDSPMSEVFGFMDLLMERQRQEAERERMKFWEAHLSAIFAQMPQEGEHPDFARARENFLRVIQPEPSNKPKKQFEWPAEIQEAIDSETPLLIASDGEKGGN